MKVSNSDTQGLAPTESTVPDSENNGSQEQSTDQGEVGRHKPRTFLLIHGDEESRPSTALGGKRTGEDGLGEASSLQTALTFAVNFAAKHHGQFAAALARPVRQLLDWLGNLNRSHRIQQHNLAIQIQVT